MLDPERPRTKQRKLDTLRAKVPFARDTQFAKALNFANTNNLNTHCGYMDIRVQMHMCID